MFPFYRHLKKIFDLNPIQHVPYFAKLARGILELRRSGSVGRRDLVQLMLEATEESNNEVKTLTDEEIIGQSITFLVAGSETTGSTLALIAYHLAYYPEIQERLLREIDDATRSTSLFRVLSTSTELSLRCCVCARLVMLMFVIVWRPVSSTAWNSLLEPVFISCRIVFIVILITGQR